jgi:hypothetical protein
VTRIQKRRGPGRIGLTNLRIAQDLFVTPKTV